MKRVMMAFALWCSMAVSLADDAVTDTDLSMKYLGQIFGDVPGALQGNGSGLIGGLFNIFNEGVMAVAAIWLLYTIAQVVMVTATSDGPQKSLKNWMLWLRVILGFGMLIPGPSGYCIAQQLMMQVVVQGVRLADTTWDYALSYLQDGGTFFKMPNHDSGGLHSLDQLDSFIGGSDDAPGKASLAYRLYQAQACMFASNAFNKAHAKTMKQAELGAKHTYSMIAVPPKLGADGRLLRGTGALYFPGYGNTSGFVLLDNEGGLVSQPASNCGVMKLPDLKQPATLTHYKTVFAAMQQAAMDMQGLAHRAVGSMGVDQVGLSGAAPSAEYGSAAISQAIIDYLTLVQPVADAQQRAQQSNKRFLDMADQARKQGWFNAGGFYWDLVRWNDSMATSSGNPANLVPVYQAPIDDLPPDLSDIIGASTNQLRSGMWSGARDVLHRWLTGANSNEFKHVGISGKAIMGIDLGVIDIPLNKMIGKINSAMTTMNAYNPMRVSFNVGKYALSAAGWIWAALIIVLTPLSVAMGVCESANPGNVIFKGIQTWLTPLALASAGFLFATGVILTFYAPIYPYLLFLFGVIGWLLYVIEAMVAAPLVAFGMSHPEGHDFLGRAEQALMLALGVFLRPALMVLGYMVGILMVYVASGFLNLVLGQVFMSTYRNKYDPNVGDAIDGAWSILGGSPQGDATHFTGNAIADSLLVPVILMLYSTIMLETVNQCFGAIHQLPDMVLRWIGGPVHQSQAEQRAHAVKGEISSAGQQAAQAGGKIPEATSGGIAGVGVGGYKAFESMMKKNNKPDDAPSNDNLSSTAASGGDVDAAVAAGGALPPP